MKYLSLFSGIEAATQAWHQQGWKPVAFSEIEPFPCAVLEHHYPHIPNLGDITKITEAQIKKIGQIDLIVFGSPCQDLSVAGKRKGLDGERSGLFTTAIKIIKWARKHCGARFALWENVPGAFSSNGGKDFAEVVRLLSGAELSFERWSTAGVAIGKDSLLEWRVLDAQHFGVPQRRRRIFALADFGDWTDRQPILFEPESVSRNFKTSREAGKGIARVAGTLAANGGGLNRPAGNANELDFLIPKVVGALDTECGGGRMSHQTVTSGHIISFPQMDKMGTLTARMFSSLGSRDIEVGAVIPVSFDVYNQEETPNVSKTVSARADQDTASCIAIQGSMIGRNDKNGPQGSGIDQNVSFTLNITDRHAVAFNANARPDELNLSEVNQGLTCSQSPAVLQKMQVRRLTPKECERLQGFPDDFTKIPYKNKHTNDCPDSPRYKALGNSMAVPVMKWIGQRITEVAA